MPGSLEAESALDAQTLAALEAAAPAEILVGVHAVNQARSVVRVAEAAAAGLTKHLPGRRAALLLADGGSADGTWDAVRAWAAAGPADPAVCCLRLKGAPGRGRAILAILAAARRLGVSAGALVDAGLVGLSPEGVERLLTPALEGAADFISPAYTHGVAEGTLTTNLLAPLTRALFGVRLQQVVGGCAGLSGALAGRLLEAGGAEAGLVGRGAEVWLPVEALALRARVAEASLGRKVVDPGLAPPDLATTLAHTAGPLFRLMERHSAVWAEVRGSQPAPLLGEPPTLLLETGRAQTDRMVHAFRLGLKDLLPVWEQVVAEETLGHLYPLGLLPPEEFRLPPDVWARVVGDFAVAHHERRLARDHLLRALTPLYLGRVASFLLEAQAAPRQRLPGLLEALGRAFEAEKERLAARWR